MKGKRIIRRLLCLALAAMLLAMAGMPAVAAGKVSGRAFIVATSKGSHLNLREGPGLGYGVQAKLPRGTVVVYEATKYGWWKVSTAEGIGYVDKRYLWPAEFSPAAKYSSVDNLYVRTGPSVYHFAYGKLRPGRLVTIEKQDGSWSYINYKGYTGWVASKYLIRVK